MTSQETVTRYCAVLSELSPERLDELTALCAQEMRFKDPFHDTVGLDAYLRILRKMFDGLESHSFGIVGRADTDDRVFLRWVFQARLRGSGRPMHIEGMSELMVDRQGLISSHVDFWDVGRDFYERLPLLGALIAWVRRRAAA